MIDEAKLLLQVHPIEPPCPIGFEVRDKESQLVAVLTLAEFDRCAQQLANFRAVRNRWAGVAGDEVAASEAIRRAAFLECAEIAERAADTMAAMSTSQSNGIQRAAALRALAARYRQMAEGSMG